MCEGLDEGGERGVAVLPHLDDLGNGHLFPLRNLEVAELYVLIDLVYFHPINLLRNAITIFIRSEMISRATIKLD